jgi:hypothetical protein
MARHGAERSLRQAGFDLLLELIDGRDPAPRSQDLGDLARFDDGCVHAVYAQWIARLLSDE